METVQFHIPAGFMPAQVLEFCPYREKEMIIMAEKRRTWKRTATAAASALLMVSATAAVGWNSIAFADEENGSGIPSTIVHENVAFY